MVVLPFLIKEMKDWSTHSVSADTLISFIVNVQVPLADSPQFRSVIRSHFSSSSKVIVISGLPPGCSIDTVPSGDVRVTSKSPLEKCDTPRLTSTDSTMKSFPFSISTFKLDVKTVVELSKIGRSTGPELF